MRADRLRLVIDAMWTTAYAPRRGRLPPLGKVGDAVVLVIARRFSVTRWRRPDEPPEMAGQLRLIVEANLGRHVGRPHAALKQLLRACDAEVRQVSMRRHANLSTKGAAQVELVEVGVVREMVERDRVADSLAEVL
jgi:hypothetical protein